LSPIRILILAILFYIAYRIIVSGNKKSQKPVSRNNRTDASTPVDDVLEEDPVCKRLVPRKQAKRANVNGKTYYFCSDDCCEAFRKEQGDPK